MAEWADSRGCLAAYVCEHHCSDDGYLPSPLLLTAALAARTRNVRLIVIVILPFYDPVRLSEDMAVLDGLDLTARGQLGDEKLHVLRRLLAGETVEVDGRRMTVTPQPATPGGPAMMWA
jgi:alkanesulfonate monooxygenase SsuD/methylene tetrahydromethanopterin reductase-like flavin-dependent oxidoreductase (luciferase family)